MFIGDKFLGVCCKCVNLNNIPEMASCNPWAWHVRTLRILFMSFELFSTSTCISFQCNLFS